MTSKKLCEKSCTRRLVKFLSGENPRWTGYIKDGLMLYNGKNHRINQVISCMSGKHGISTSSE